jgi:hypothetical protein
MISTRLSGAIIAVAFAFTLAACGSGGSSISSSPPPPPPPAGSATLTWNGPTVNSDSTGLTDLAGYRIYRSTTSGSYTGSPAATVLANSTDGSNETGRTATVNNLASGTHYFVVRAYDSSGNESGNAQPGEVSKTIP